MADNLEIGLWKSWGRKVNVVWSRIAKLADGNARSQVILIVKPVRQVSITAVVMRMVKVTMMMMTAITSP